MGEVRETVQGETAQTEAPAGRRMLTWVGGGLALVALLAFSPQIGTVLKQYLPALRAWLEGLGMWGPVIFILIYGCASVAWIPGSALTALSGTLFGLGAGTVIAWLGASFGALCSFLVARYIARDRVEARLADNPRLEAIDRAVGEQGLRIVFLLRLSPLFPFVVLNSLLGLTRVRFAHYNLGSFGMLPGTFLYVYIGYVGGEAANAVAGGGASTALWTGRIIGLLAAIAVTVVVARIAKRALSQQVGS